MIRPAHAPVLGTLALRAIALPAMLLLAVGCQNRQSGVIPNRVLDRPLDVVLACVRRDADTGELRPQSLDQCSDAVAESVCGDLRLIGFVANSERNDIALFSRCTGAVIDMNVGAPGPQLISAGQVPSSMTISTGVRAGCVAVSANLGSCDLSVLDVAGLASYAFEEPPEEDPSAYVSTVVPRRADGTPLGARPGQVLATPPDLSNAATGSNSCDPAYPGSVYVTFPSCQLVAEVDLRTQRILQSRQFVRDANGAITVVDTGADPSCPIDCSQQFLDPAYADALQTAPAGDPEGMYPLAMALVTPPSDPTACVDDADLQVKDPSLYVGGLGADVLFELRFDGKTWTDDPLEFEITGAQGVSAIRPTPPMIMNSGPPGDVFYQFLYVLAGDGSTRVVRRNFDENRDELGIECDTQVDPTAVVNTACHPAEFPGESPPDRRPFARGPGLRAPNGAIITDWTFQKWYDVNNLAEGASKDRCQGVSADDAGATGAVSVVSSPFTGVGVVGVGATSFGRLVFGVFDQFAGNRVIDPNVDHLGLLDARIPPHSLWPQIDPTTAPVDPSALPRLEDKEPDRLVPGEVTLQTVTRQLSPAVRRIDHAYELRTACKDDGDCGGSTCEKTGDQGGFCEVVGPALSPPVSPIDQDLLHVVDDGDDTSSQGLYSEDVARLVVRDYSAWDSGEWNLFWEGEIPNTRSANGQLVCQSPGWQEGTCLSTVPGDTRLVDQTAEFCDDGVLAGDRLFLLGCAEDADCGLGQYCLVDTDAPLGATGLCVSQAVFDEGRDDQLREICRPFLRDDCGAARREFLITRAFQNEVWLQVLDRRVEAYVMPRPPNVADDATVDTLCRGSLVPGGSGACADVEDNPTCGDPGQPPCCQGTYDFAANGFIECEGRLLCAPAQPDAGCASHAECAQLDPEFPLCIDRVCKRVCGDDEDCAQTPLPGPACFRELVRYQVNARNSFVVRGPGNYDFLAQRVKADPETDECYEDTSVSNLLTSRIRLGSDENDTRTNLRWPIPSCPADGERPDSGSPNPCFIDTPRPDALQRGAASALYHVFSYGTDPSPQPVPALRYSNPMMSLVLDLTSLKDLTQTIPGTNDLLWPSEVAGFRRSRIPGAFRETFTTRRGFTPYDATVVTSSVSLVGPTRIINAPELSTVFVVDSSGGTGSTGTRGQVVRVTLAAGQVNPDVQFLVR